MRGAQKKNVAFDKSPPEKVEMKKIDDKACFKHTDARMAYAILQSK